MQNNFYVPTQWTQAERKSAVDCYRYKKSQVEKMEAREEEEAEEGIKKETALNGKLRSRCDFF